MSRRSHQSDITSLSRRTFVRGALASTALAGTGALAACVPPPATRASQGAPAGTVAEGRPRRKVSKLVARYQNRPNRGQQCAACIHFQPPAGCSIVAGFISSNGWSRYFEAA